MNLADLETRRARLDTAFPPAHIRVVPGSRGGAKMTVVPASDAAEFPLCRPCVEELIGESPPMEDP